MGHQAQRSWRRWVAATVLGCLTAILFLFVSKSAEGLRDHEERRSTPVAIDGVTQTQHSVSSPLHRVSALANRTAPGAEQIVRSKVARFGAMRREFARELARRKGVTLSADVDRFFDAVEKGDWEQVERTFKALNGGDSSAGFSGSRDPALTWIWPAIIDAYGVAEQAHLWPAQQLLDYGNEILNALDPGMIYIGGTDSGRWIPALLSDTSDGERHVVLTQNGLADATYLEYMRVQYEGRLALLDEKDSAAAFEAYIADARERLAHDQQNPSAPKRVKPTEQLRLDEGNVHISGVGAVMAINEKLLQRLIAKNPELSFGLQESVPLPSTHATGIPNGPIMHLNTRTADGAVAFTEDVANDSLAYWKERSAAAQLASTPKDSPSLFKSYSHHAAAAANLLAARGFPKQAEQAYRLSSELWPENPETTAHLSRLLEQQGRRSEAERLRQDFITRHPSQREAFEKLR